MALADQTSWKRNYQLKYNIKRDKQSHGIAVRWFQLITSEVSKHSRTCLFFYLAQAGHSGLFPHVPCSACFRQPGDDFQVGPGIDMPHIPSPTHEDVDQWHQARWPWACEGCTTAQSSSIVINLYPCAVCMMSLVHSSLNRCWCFIFFIVIEEW
jgi:hypothetical protein